MDKCATLLITKMSKLAISTDYNQDTILATVFDIDKDEFLSSDLVTNFTVIEDFDKRISIGKVKTIEKDTITWIYSTLKMRMGIS